MSDDKHSSHHASTHGSHGSESKNHDDDISIDFSKFKKFFVSKTFKVMILTLLVLIPVILTAYIRFQAMDLPATDDWATSSVNNYYRNQISQQVASQYPNLPVTQRNQLVNEQFSTFQKTNSAQIDAQIYQTSQYFKTGMQYQENNATYTFLGDLDSYFYLRQARNIEEKGMVCDVINRDSVCIDDHMIAPLNTIHAEPSMHPYATAYLHRFLHFFNSKSNLMQAAFILPTLIAMIAAIAAFFLGRKLMNNVAGFFAAMFIATSPILLSRTMGSDTDIWNIMFPIIIIWLFLEIFDSKVTWKKVLFGVLTAAALAAFSFAWSGWWYTLYFIILALVGHIIFVILKKYLKHRHFKNIIDREIKDDLITLGTIFATTMILVTLIFSFGSFVSAIKSPFYFSSNLKVAAVSDLWPNVLTTVAELNEAGLSTIVSQASTGMTILFALAMLGIIFTLVKKDPDTKEYMLIGASAILYLIMISANALNMNYKIYLLLLMLPVAIGFWMILMDEKTRDIKPALILILWFVGMIYTSTQGLRFILLLVPAFCIALGVAIGYLYQYFERLLSSEFKLNEILSRVIVFLVLCLVLITPVTAGINAGAGYVPSMTKGWWDSLSKIREQSNPDSIITSWWDFGHWFKYVADRKVTFDGASQYPVLAHLAGRSLQTNDENETVALLRMLACGNFKAVYTIDLKYNDTEKSENIMSNIIMMSKEDAGKYLKNLGYTQSEMDLILSYSHCNPPDVYYITSEDMVGKAGVWGHFGTWSIDKAYIINNLRNSPMNEAIDTMKSRWNYTDEEATKIYYDVQALQTDREMNDWIAPWPNYATGGLAGCTNTPGDIIYCDLNIGIGGNGQQNLVLERAAINISNPKSGQVLLGIYDGTTNAKLGTNIVSWGKVIVIDNDVKTYKPDNASLNLAFLLNVNHDGNTTTYNAVVADPLLIDSTFTKLFYLDGKTMTHFEKFSDETDITGTRIIIWKVKW